MMRSSDDDEVRTTEAYASGAGNMPHAVPGYAPAFRHNMQTAAQYLAPHIHNGTNMLGGHHNMQTAAQSLAPHIHNDTNMLGGRHNMQTVAQSLALHIQNDTNMLGARHNMQTAAQSLAPHIHNDTHMLGGRHNMQTAAQSLAPHIHNDMNMLSGRPNLSCLNEFHSNATRVNVNSSDCQMSSPELSTRDLCHYMDGNNTATRDCLMNPSMEHRESGVYMNFVPPSSINCPVYSANSHGAEASTVRNRVPEMRGKLSSSESSESALPRAFNFVIERNRNDTRIAPPSLDSSQNIDRNFLSLGVGGQLHIRQNSNFSTREIAARLEDVGSCHDTQGVRGSLQIRPNSNFSTSEIAARFQDVVASSHDSFSVGQNTRNPLNLSQLRSGAVRTQTCELPDSRFNGVGCLSAYGEGGITGNIGSTPNSIPSPLQASMCGQGFGSSENHDNSIFDMQSPSWLIGNALIPEPGQGSSSLLRPQSMKSPKFPSQPTAWQQDHFRQSSIGMTADMSADYLPGMHSGNFNSYGRLGNQIQPTAGSFAQIDSSLSHLQPFRQHTPHNFISTGALGGNSSNLFPERYWSQIPTGSGLFPRRLGIQPNDVVTARIARGSQHPFQNYQCAGAYIQMPVAPPVPFGPRPIHVAPPFIPFRPPTPSGQHQLGMQTQSQKGFPGVQSAGAQVIPAAKFDARPQASSVVSRPPLKRAASENVPTTNSSQRRKIVPHPVANRPAPYLKQSLRYTSNPNLATAPSGPLHVKWEGFDELTPLPSGHKCLLCKRDLSFTAEGEEYQPNIPPPVAILPCGHVFHDDCLQRITPQDQSKSPPCIPCAIGET